MGGCYDLRVDENSLSSNQKNSILVSRNRPLALVVGAAGFLGSHLCERLLKEAKVICIDDFSNSRPENINHLLQYPDFEFINYQCHPAIKAPIAV